LVGQEGGDAGGRILYHGTDLASAEGLAGEPLKAAEAAACSFGAESGFYLATSFEDAVYFGSLHSVLEVRWPLSNIGEVLLR
jgi:hypothetical protein